MKTYVIHHSADFDGIFCREIAKRFLPDAVITGWDYGQPTPFKEELTGREALYILDLSVPDLMDHPNLIWIDHHKSAIEKYPASIPGMRVDGVAACRLAWQWFNAVDRAKEGYSCAMLSKQAYINRIVSEPWAVRLAGEYDIWDKRDPDAELFQHGLRSRDLSSADWALMLVEDRKASIEEIEALMDVGHTKNLIRPDGTTPNQIVDGLLDNGRVLQYAKNQENKSIITHCGFDVTFEGLNFLAVNHARFNSLLFTAGVKPEHDALLGFNYDGKGKWRVSLYHTPGREHHDLSVIAVRFGGGGHRGACGFTCTELPFKLPERK